MSDTTPTVTPEMDAPVNTAEAAPTITEKVIDWQAEAEKWKSLSRKNEEAAKANKSAAEKLAEIEDANRTELEKAQARAEAAEKAAREALEAKLRSDVAAAKGVPAGLLTGSTQEELEAAADALLAFKGTTPGAPSPDGQGKQGEPVGEGNQQLTQADLDRMVAARDDDGIAKARAEGRFNKLLGITS